MKWAIDIGESFQIALGALRANKARGTLTTLGIIIGIVAVVLTMTAANGLENRFRQTFSAVGADVIYVSRMPWVIMNDFFLYRNRPRIDLRQAGRLEQKLRGKAIVNPTVGGSHDVKYRSESMAGVTVIGTTEKQIMVSSGQPETGRFITGHDVAYKTGVCVIGTAVREGLFGGESPVNKKVRIGRSVFRVVGVMEKQGGSFLGGPNFDRQVYLPITSYVKAFGGAHGRQDVSVAVKAPSREAMTELEFEVIGEMRKIRNLRPSERDDFSINKLDTLLGAFNNVMGVVLLVGLLVTGISLFVGGGGRDEHHVRFGHRANAGDRHPQGDRSEAPEHPRAVPVRIVRDLPHGRFDRHGAGGDSNRGDQPRLDAGERVASHPRRGRSRLHIRRDAGRSGSGIQGRETRSDRGVAI